MKIVDLYFISLKKKICLILVYLLVKKNDIEQSINFEQTLANSFNS